MKFIISSSSLLKHLQSISGVLNSNNPLPILDNFLFEINEGNLTISASDLETTMTCTLPVVAKDAHKLVRYRRNDAKSDVSASFILPKKPLNLLKNILASADTRVKIDYNQSNTFFSFENYTLICRLIDGRYPNYEAVIPVDN